jgi:hypothetical protein
VKRLRLVRTQEPVSNVETVGDTGQSLSESGAAPTETVPPAHPHSDPPPEIKHPIYRKFSLGIFK